MTAKSAKKATSKPETDFALALRSAMPVSAGFKALAGSLGIPAETLAQACLSHKVLVVGSPVLEPLNTLLTYKDMAGGEAWPMGDDRQTGGADMVDFATELHGDTVKAIGKTGLDMSVLVIRATDEDGNQVFWSNGDGWVESPQESTLIYGYEVSFSKMPAPPADTAPEWVSFVAAVEAHENPDSNSNSAASETHRG